VRVTGIADVQRPLDGERRPHPVILGVLSLAVLLLLILWIRYDPIERGTVGACPEGSHEVPAGGAPDEDMPDEDTLVCAVSNRDTTTVELATSAYNGGLVPVRVTDVRLPEEIQGVFEVEDVLMWPRNNQRGDVDTDLVPFEPFRLAPGDERMLWVQGALPACEAAPSDRVLLFRVLPVRTSVLGLPRDSEVPLDPAVRVIVERC
jgi:hypothetical protein